MRLRDDAARGIIVPTFLNRQSQLGGLSAYIVTLGEMGCIYWIKTHSGQWQGPRWSCQAGSPSRLSQDEMLVQYADLRNGLGCGDVARAGFTASLLASMNFGQPRTIKPEWIEWAIGWANWFGTQKVKFFSLEDYLEFIKEQAPLITKDLVCGTNALLHGRRTFGPKSHSLAFQFGPLIQANEIVPEASRWLLSLIIHTTDRSVWDHEVELWQKSRQYHESQHNEKA
jgi:hypothetical protein